MAFLLQQLSSLLKFTIVSLFLDYAIFDGPCISAFFCSARGLLSRDSLRRKRPGPSVCLVCTDWLGSLNLSSSAINFHLPFHDRGIHKQVHCKFEGKPTQFTVKHGFASYLYGQIGGELKGQLRRIKLLNTLFVVRHFK